MKSRGLLIALLALGGLLAVAVLGVAAVLLLFDPEDYRDDAERAFLERTGRELELAGPLQVSIFPWLAVETGAATVGNREGFVQGPFLTLRHARVGVRLLPLLLERRVQLAKVEVAGLRLHLRVAQDGTNNWSDLIERKATAPQEQTAADAAPLDISINGLSIADTELGFEDARSGARLAFRAASVETGLISRGTPFDTRLDLTAMSGDRPLARVTLQAQVDFTQPGQAALATVRGHVGLPGLGRAPGGLPIDLVARRIARTRDSGELRLDGLEIHAGGATISGDLGRAGYRHGSGLRGTLRLAAAEPRRLFEALGMRSPATRDARALARLGGTAELRLTHSSAEFSALDLTVDETHVRGNVGLVDFKRKAVRFDIEADGLDLDRYRPRVRPATAARRADHGKTAATARPLPIGALRRIDVGGSIAVGRLRIGGVALDDVLLSVTSREGQLQVTRAEGGAFGGRLSARLALDVSGSAPRLRLESSFTNVDVGALLSQLVGAQQLIGRGRMNATLEGSADDVPSMIRSLHGPFEMAVTDGALVGADLWHEIEGALAASKLLPASSGTSSGRTEFRELAARGRLDDRTLSCERLDFNSDFLAVHAMGDVNSAAGTVDLTGTARLLEVPPGRLLGIDLKRVQDVDIPFEVGGTLRAPKVDTDVTAVVAGTVRKGVTDVGKGVGNQIKKLRPH